MCGQHKTRSDFHRQRRSPDGLNYKCKACNYAAARRWKSAHPERRAERHRANPRPAINRSLRRLYGIDLADYEQRLAMQRGICAICGTAPTTIRRLDVDHDHATGRIRGLLCTHCNLALGHMRHDPERARAMANYLERAAA